MARSKEPGYADELFSGDSRGHAVLEWERGRVVHGLVFALDPGNRLQTEPRRPGRDHGAYSGLVPHPGRLAQVGLGDVMKFIGYWTSGEEVRWDEFTNK